MDPRDIASLAVFLASDAAKAISGEVVPIDGDMQLTRCCRIAVPSRRLNPRRALLSAVAAIH
jgi:hypothetical protein